MMDEPAFRAEVRDWLREHLQGQFLSLSGRSAPGNEENLELRREWEQLLGKGGWIGLSWPEEFGGRGASESQHRAFHEEYAKAGAPARVELFGEHLLGPSLIAFGSPEQRARFLPPILRAEQFWCQGFSEPDAGSDLANIRTTAVLDGGEWVINGQKVWTTLAHRADWCFLLCRTEPGATRNRGLSFLLVPMDQPGIEIRPLRQLTGSAEFNEVFFRDARTTSDLVVGERGQGWEVAVATLGFERSTAFVSYLLIYEQEWREVVDAAQANGRVRDPVIRQRLAQSRAELHAFRHMCLRSFAAVGATGRAGPESSVTNLFRSTWHQRLGELAADVLGPDLQILDGAPYRLSELQELFLFSRCDTIAGGTSEIQRNIIAEQLLGLPREPRP